MYRKNNIILISLQGKHKKVAECLAKKMPYSVIDIDEEIEKIFFQGAGIKKSYDSIAKTHGADYFRQLERKALYLIKDQNKKIVALPFYTLLNPDNRYVLNKLGQIVFLVNRDFPKFLESKRFEVFKIIEKERKKDISEKDYFGWIRLFMNNCDYFIEVEKKSDSKIADEVINHLGDIIYF